MRLLLDTHAFLWWASEDDRLSDRARRRIASARNDVFVSAVSAWEIAAKTASGRLRLDEPAGRLIPSELARSGFQALPLSITHALAVLELPQLHADPFDRLLIAQALVESASLVTGDQQIARYAVKVVW